MGPRFLNGKVHAPCHQSARTAGGNYDTQGHRTLGTRSRRGCGSRVHTPRVRVLLISSRTLFVTVNSEAQLHEKQLLEFDRILKNLRDLAPVFKYMYINSLNCTAWELMITKVRRRSAMHSTSHCIPDAQGRSANACQRHITSQDQAR